MAEPKKRLTNTRSGNRRSHLSLKSTFLSICDNCKQKKLPHQICPHCGYYKGEKILVK